MDPLHRPDHHHGRRLTCPGYTPTAREEAAEIGPSSPVPLNRTGVSTVTQPPVLRTAGASSGAEGIATSYGHTIRVKESSNASGPHVWMFISDSPVVSGHDPQLSLDEAIALRAALDQFIEGVPGRWTGGAEMLAEAKQRVLGSL